MTFMRSGVVVFSAVVLAATITSTTGICDNLAILVGEACCSSSTNDPCSKGLGYCAADGTCIACGFLAGLPCCPGDITCNDGNGVCSAATSSSPFGICSPCGLPTQPCCPGASTCKDGSCSPKTEKFPDGICTACGKPGKPCCPGETTCSAGYCQSVAGDKSSPGICTACGGPGDSPCCPRKSGKEACKFGFCMAIETRYPYGTCKSCDFGANTPCCPGQKRCSNGAGVCLEPTTGKPYGVCRICGSPGERCCPGKTRCPGGYCTGKSNGRPDGTCRLFCEKDSDCEDFQDCTIDTCNLKYKKCRHTDVKDGILCAGGTRRCQHGQCLLSLP